MLSTLALAACGGQATGASPPASASSVAPATSASANIAASPGASSAAPVGAIAQTARQPDKIAIAYTAATSLQLPPLIAKEKGFFAQNGLDVDVSFIGAGSNPSAAVLAGQLQAYIGSTEAIQADLAGADLAFIDAPSTAFPFYLFSIPSITSASGLKGKRVAVTAVGSATYTAARLALRSLKLDPDKDVSLAVVNNPPAVLAALQNGAVQAGAIGPATLVQTRKAGMHELVDLAKTGVSYPVGWSIVSRGYMEGHQDIVQRYEKSFVEGLAFEIQKPEETQRLLGHYMKTNDAELLKTNYEITAPYLQKVPFPSAESIRNALNEMADTNPAAKSADPSSFIEPRFVKSLQDSGFIASLYK